MIFFSEGSNCSGNRGNREKEEECPMFLGNMEETKMIFSIHFDVDSEEFNQLVQIGYMKSCWTPFLATSSSSS
jgi:hypothetical protein